MFDSPAHEVLDPSPATVEYFFDLFGECHFLNAMKIVLDSVICEGQLTLRLLLQLAFKFDFEQRGCRSLWNNLEVRQTEAYSTYSKNNSEAPIAQELLIEQQVLDFTGKNITAMLRARRRVMSKAAPLWRRVTGICDSTISCIFAESSLVRIVRKNARWHIIRSSTLAVI